MGAHNLLNVQFEGLNMSSKPDLDWMAEAKRHLGMHEIKHASILWDWISDLNVKWLGKNPAWCGVFVAKVFKNCGMKYPQQFYRAKSYRTFGTQLSRPAYGCLAIKNRKGGDHVCFVAGKLKDGRLVCIGGNQSDSVNYAVYNYSDFDTFVWAGKTSRPAAHRYDLDVLELNGKFKVNVSES